MHLKAMPHVIKKLFFAAPLLLIISCEPGNSAKQFNSDHEIKQSNTQKPKKLDPGQTGPNPALLQVIAIAFRSKQGVYPAKAQPTMANGWSNYFKEANALRYGLPSADTTTSQPPIDVGAQGMEQLYQLEIIYWGSPSHGEQTSG